MCADVTMPKFEMGTMLERIQRWSVTVASFVPLLSVVRQALECSCTVYDYSIHLNEHTL
jgi:hypothetical protein